MSESRGSGRFNPVLFILLAAALVIQCKPSGAPQALEGSGPVKVRFSLEPGEVLRYKGNSTDEMNFYGLDISSVHTDEITMTVREKTEEGNYRIRIRFDKSTDQMRRSGEVYDSPGKVKPEGRTVEADITPLGELAEARGVIPGLQDGELKDYIGKWFAELPEEAVAVGGSWEKDLSDSTESSTVSGTVTMTLDGVGEEKGMSVIFVSGRAVTSIERDAAGGEITGEATADIEAALALDGGYVVKYSVESQFSGKMTGVNPQTAKEETTEISRSSYTTVELLK